MVRFVRAGVAKLADEMELEGVGDELVKRSVGARVARDLASTFPEEKIREKLYLHDHLTQMADKRVSKNPAGFLVAAIKDDFSLRISPAPLRSAAQPLAAESSSSARVPSPATPVRRADEEHARALTEFGTWWEKLSESEQKRFESDALRAADKFLFSQYDEGKEKAGPLFQAVRRNMLLAHYRRTNK
jgi:hypothetical protein